MTARDAASTRNARENTPFGAYYQRDIPRPDPLLMETGPGTPMGEYLRRFWQPVCLTEQLTDVPLAIRIMGEDLVAFRDGSGQIGVLNRYCSHRGASLEYGRIGDKGIRCCYHGWAFDVDGKILEIPGEPPESRLKDSFHHGAYPAFDFHGIVHAYMGPPELKPDFTAAEIFDISGVEFAAHALPLNNNWLQTHENNVDPVPHRLPALTLRGLFHRPHRLHAEARLAHHGGRQRRDVHLDAACRRRLGLGAQPALPGAEPGLCPLAL